MSKAKGKKTHAFTVSVTWRGGIKSREAANAVRYSLRKAVAYGEKVVGPFYPNRITVTPIREA